MEFIARAGSLIDRGHRVIGILLFVIVIQFFWTNSIRNEKQVLQDQINYQNATQSIYVVPNSQSGVYKPAKGALLMTTFVDYITQNLLTYTPANLGSQYKSVRKFFSSKMLVGADNYYRKELKKVKAESLSSLFIADRASTELKEFKELRDKRTQYGEKTYEIVVKGVQNTIIGGSVLYANKLHVKLQLQETLISEENPFGFRITKMEQIKIKER